MVKDKEFQVRLTFRDCLDNQSELMELIQRIYQADKDWVRYLDKWGGHVK
jgi:hypothetical protein